MDTLRTTAKKSAKKPPSRVVRLQILVGHSALREPLHPRGELREDLLGGPLVGDQRLRSDPAEKFGGGPPTPRRC